MKKLALLGLFLMVSSTRIFAGEESCETGTDQQQADAGSQDHAKADNADAKDLIKDSKK